MKKRVLLVLVALMAVITAMTQDYDFSAVAPTGQTLYYEINGNEVSVVPPVADFPCWNGYTMPVGNLVIPDSVSYMGEIFPVTSIGPNAFHHDNQVLTSVTIPDGVTSIGHNAFQLCRGLVSVNIPQNVTAIYNYTFSSCNSLLSITLPEGLNTLSLSAFRECSSLTSITIPSSLTTIGQKAFYLCTNLTHVIISEGVVNISTDAFRGCTNLSSVTIPSSVSSISSTAFTGCNNITYLNYNNLINTPNFIPHNNLHTLVVGNNVTSIYSNAFSNISTLTHITLGNSVSSIGENAFSSCNNIDTIIALPAIAPILGSSAFANVPSNVIVNIPCGSTYSYSSTWTQFSNFVEQFDYSLSALSADVEMGSVNIDTDPTCQSPAVVSATANYGYQFDHWSDGNTDNPRTLTVTQDTSLMAYFVSATNPSQEDSLFNVVANNAMGGGVYPSGSTAIVFALPQVDLQFAGWSDGEAANPRHIVVTSDTTLTALYRAPDTVRVYDTVINIVYDTTEYNHYYYDTTHIYDTLIIYDTTRVFDTLVYVNIDTLNHYYYDTTHVFDTLIVLDTTRIYDTMIYVNIDTLNHYYFDTTHIYDTLVVYDTTRVYDTLVYVNHYYYDTTLIFDTLIYVNIDTLHYYHYDTTHTIDTVMFFDTTSITHYIFDSIWVYDSVWVYDTTFVLDTVYFFDTVYIEVPVQGVDGVEMVNVKVYTYHTQIIVEGAQGLAVRLYDINGRLIATKRDDSPITYFYVQTSGTYLVRVGEYPARRVVVIR